MKINFISFLHPFKFHGGGELDNRHLIGEGKKRGHDIKMVSRVKNKYIHRLLQPGYHFHRNPDIWILADIFNVPNYKLQFKKGFLEEIVNNQPFVHLDNAYVDICTSGPLPCHGIKKDSCIHCTPSLAETMYEKSLANVFLSPLHASVINQFWDNRFLHKSIIIKPLIDTALFYDQKKIRDIEHLYVGTISRYKGYENIKERFGNDPDFLFIGKNALGYPVFGKHIANVPNEKLIDYYNRAKNFVHLPEWKEPMGRTIIEAALCGCTIISNEHTGACSFDFELGNKDNYKDAATGFWSKIENLV